MYYIIIMPLYHTIKLYSYYSLFNTSILYDNIIRYANGGHLSAVWENTALVQ